MAIDGTVNCRSRTEIPISGRPPSASLPRKGDCRERQAAIPAGGADLRCRKLQILRGNAVFGATANPKPARKWRLSVPQVANPARPAALSAPKKRKPSPKPRPQRFLSLFGNPNPVCSFRHPCQARSGSGRGALREYFAQAPTQRGACGRDPSLGRVRGCLRGGSPGQRRAGRGGRCGDCLLGQ